MPAYKDNDPTAIQAFIDAHPFAFVSGCDAENHPIATQVPVFVEEEAGRMVLRGHIMRNTDHHRAFLYNPNVLVVFTGPHTYVSGTWYSDPNVASTWNFMSVHVRGTIRFLDDAALERVLRKTSMHFENNNAASPTVFDNLPEAFKQKFMPAIVAFEIEIIAMDHVFKLSQDRDKESYHNIIRKLREQGRNGKFIAAEMEKRAQSVFPAEDAE
jgi:transcriptional regulator